MSDTITKLRAALCALWTHNDLFVRHTSNPESEASFARVKDMVRDALRATEGRAHPSWGDWGHFNNAASGTREPSAATGPCGPGCQRYGAACPPKPPGFRPTECSEFVPAGAGGEKVEVVPNCATCRVVVEHDRMRKEHDTLLHQRDAAVKEREEFVVERSQYREQLCAQRERGDKALNERDVALKANEKYVQEARRLLSERDRAVVPLVALAARLGVEGFTDKNLEQAYRLGPVLDRRLAEMDSWKRESVSWKLEAEQAKANAMKWEKEVAELRTALDAAKGPKS